MKMLKFAALFISAAAVLFAPTVSATGTSPWPKGPVVYDLIVVEITPATQALKDTWGDVKMAFGKDSPEFKYAYDGFGFPFDQEALAGYLSKLAGLGYQVKAMNAIDVIGADDGGPSPFKMTVDSSYPVAITITDGKPMEPAHLVTGLSGTLSSHPLTDADAAPGEHVISIDLRYTRAFGDKQLGGVALTAETAGGPKERFVFYREIPRLADDDGRATPVAPSAMLVIVSAVPYVDNTPSPSEQQ